MGKYSKKRFCPALQKDISAAQCGEWRFQEVKCAPDCVHNPFALGNFDRFNKLEIDLRRKCMNFCADRSPDPRAWWDRFESKTKGDARGMGFWGLWCVFYEKLEKRAGTCFEIWKDQGFEGLKNDERVLLEQQSQSKIALLEVRRKVHEDVLEAVNLLALEPDQRIMVYSRDLARDLVRFDTVAALIYPLEPYWVPHPATLLIDDVSPLDPKEMFLGLMRHLKAPSDLQDWPAYMTEQFKKVLDGYEINMKARHQRTLAQLDRDLYLFDYHISGKSGELSVFLGDHDDFAEHDLNEADIGSGADQIWVWLDPGHVKDVCVRSMKARVLFSGDKLTLEIVGKERADALKSAFEALLEGRITFLNATIQPTIEDRPLEPTTKEAELIAPFMLENLRPVTMQSTWVLSDMLSIDSNDARSRVLKDQYREYLETPNPLLLGKTPKQASQDPELKSKLVELMKVQIRNHDFQNKKWNRMDDFNWVLRELDLVGMTD